DVVGQRVVQPRRARSERRLNRGDRGQRGVVDLDQLGRVLRLVAVRGDDYGDRLADVADPVASERVLQAVLQTGVRGQTQGDRGQVSRQVGGGEHRGDAGPRQRPARVDGPNLGVRVRAADDDGVEQPGALEVGDEAA